MAVSRQCHGSAMKAQYMEPPTEKSDEKHASLPMLYIVIFSRDTGINARMKHLIQTGFAAAG